MGFRLSLELGPSIFAQYNYVLGLSSR